MPFCTNCGAKVEKETKFCTECGQAINRITEDLPTYIEAYKEKVHKCPNCGAEILSGSLTCPYCNYEFRDINQSKQLLILTDKLESIEKTRKEESRWRAFWSFFSLGKADETSIKQSEAINKYVLPDNKQDLFDFAIYAASNIDSDVFGMIIGTRYNSENRVYVKSKQVLVRAWYTKFLEAYQKATLLYKDEYGFRVIDDIYHSKELEIKKCKRKAAITGTIRFVLGMAAFLIISAPLLFIIFIMLRIMLLFMGI